MKEEYGDEGADISRFHRACKTGELGAVEVSLSSDPERIDEKSPEGWTGLVFA